MKQGKAPFVPDDALERTLRAQRGHHALRNQTILLISHFMGLRAMELAALKVSDVFDPGTGQVKEVVRLTANMTKGEKFREVFLVDEVARDHVRRHLITRGRHLDAPLFLSQKGGPFSANTMQKLIANVYAKAKVSASSHSGRRSFATRLINSGADIYSVKELLGHSSIVTTQVYFATDPLRLKRLAQLR
jgi:integrase/recombinase XerD